MMKIMTSLRSPVESAESVKHAPQSDDLTNDSNEDENRAIIKRTQGPIKKTDVHQL